jgi:hypothetical protein
MSKPRVATTLRRMTALFNFIPDLRKCLSMTGGGAALSLPLHIANSARISFDADKPDLQAQMQARKADVHSKRHPEHKLDTAVQDPLVKSPLCIFHSHPKLIHILKPTSPEISDGPMRNHEETSTSQKQDTANNTDSATESDEDIELISVRKDESADLSPAGSPSPGPSKQPASPLPSRNAGNSKAALSSDSDISPARPTKKPKHLTISSDDGSEDDRKKGTGRGGAAKRGTRQPIKRGGKRF